MSIIARTNPLNLQYRVCVVTSAFSPLGVIICKTLLKANALVLGIDTRPQDESLNAGLGTHFQCEICDVNDPDTPKRIVEAAIEKYGVERMDVLVNVLEAGREGVGLERLGRLSRGLAEVMAKERKGSIVTVLGDVEGGDEEKAKEAIDLARALSAEHGKSGIRSNVVLPGSTGDSDSNKAYDDAKMHMTALMKTEKAAQQASTNPEPRLYDVGNVTLFLAGDMGESIAGAVVGLDGSYRSL